MRVWKYTQQNKSSKTSKQTAAAPIRYRYIYMGSERCSPKSLAPNIFIKCFMPTQFEKRSSERDRTFQIFRCLVIQTIAHKYMYTFICCSFRRWVICHRMWLPLLMVFIQSTHSLYQKFTKRSQKITTTTSIIRESRDRSKQMTNINIHPATISDIREWNVCAIFECWQREWTEGRADRHIWSSVQWVRCGASDRDTYWVTLGMIFGSWKPSAVNAMWWRFKLFGYPCSAPQLSLVVANFVQKITRP